MTKRTRKVYHYMVDYQKHCGMTYSGNWLTYGQFDDKDQATEAAQYLKDLGHKVEIIRYSFD